MDEIERIKSRYEERDASARLTGFWSINNPAILHIAQERERRVLSMLNSHSIDLSPMRVLDVGCGFGIEYPNYLRWGAKAGNIWGVDLSFARLLYAHQRLGMPVVQASGARLPFPDRSFDLVAQSVVFSSIVDESIRRATAEEMVRVVRPGGYVLWYDAFRSRARDPHFRCVTRREIANLFLGIDWSFATLTSDVGVSNRAQRWLGGWSLSLIDASRLLRTHLLGLGKKK
ncbi:methyltransferase domain-containing protein [Variovorax paradoxus B4]|uniref:Methyltransferase domain-containing protein n=1 Tax=Variovorax paradoxus B4 TaxID=1246301 RepID=T1XJX2_VARPD|nr:class I SAM-dependent methyltransferase [Variovorax paradoxus]AGU52435.1 methyltransferase domain-containing protein [Variovorax paradoxus B4]